MPKLKQTDQQKRQEEIKQWNTGLMATITKYMVIQHMTKPELAAKVNMKQSTFYQRCRNPGDWKRSELIDVFAVLQIPEEEKRAVQW